MAVNAKTWAERISENKNKLIGIPYSTLDCQAFVEYCMRNYAGVNTNWRGSNDMWRNAVHDHSDDFDNIDVGEWVFTIKHDGKEPTRYTDGVNAAHVGIYIGDNTVMHSTTGGVQTDVISNSKRWTHHAKANDLDYSESNIPVDNDWFADFCDELTELIKKYGGNIDET